MICYLIWNPSTKSALNWWNLDGYPCSGSWLTHFRMEFFHEIWGMRRPYSGLKICYIWPRNDRVRLVFNSRTFSTQSQKTDETLMSTPVRATGWPTSGWNFLLKFGVCEEHITDLKSAKFEQGRIAFDRFSTRSLFQLRRRKLKKLSIKKLMKLSIKKLMKTSFVKINHLQL